MATDIDAVVNNLTSFYDFSNKRVIHIGAGGGQLIGYAGAAKSVFAVDTDKIAVEHLEDAIVEQRLVEKFTVVHGDVLAVSEKADVVFFEFCLHEIERPDRALVHARSLAPEILVLDHSPDSRWAWHTDETEKATRSWSAVTSAGIVRKTEFSAVQRFDDHAQLLDKVKILGTTAIDRAAVYTDKKNIEIEMKYTAALVE